jgi:NitT/TauT family transport system permease protein
MTLRPNEGNARGWQLALLVVLLVLWHLVSRDTQVAFFLGEPIKVAGRIWSWFLPIAIAPNALFPDGLAGRADIYLHLGVTLLETVLAFGIGTLLGLACGLWLALAPTASLILDPYIKAANSIARSICRARPAGCSPACTPRWGWPSSAPWWASTWARRAAWAT